MKDEGAASGIQAGQPLDGLAAFHYSLLTTHISILYGHSMTETTPVLFEKLKRSKSLVSKQKTAQSVFFQLNFDPIGAFLRVVDDKGRDISPGHQYYTGATREVLKSIDTIKNENSFRIDWKKPAGNIYLNETDYLLWPLRHCDNFVDHQFNAIRFSETEGRIRLLIEENRKGMLNARIILSHEGNRIETIHFLNESHVFADGVIYPIQPLSENYQVLKLFQTLLLPGSLERYLSLLFSYFSNISVKYLDYAITTGEPKLTRPTLVIEKIDPNNALYLRVSTSLSGFDPDFLESYDIMRVATINDLEKKIVVSDVQHDEVASVFSEIEKLLKKHKRGMKEGPGFFMDDNLFIIEESLASIFIYAELPNIIARYTIMGAEKLKVYKVRTSKPKLTLSLSHGIDFLEGDASLEIEGFTLPLFDALNQYKKNSYITLSDGTHAIVNQNYMDRLTRLFKKQKDRIKVSFFDLPIVEELIDEKIAESAFKQSREIFLGFNTLADAPCCLPELKADFRGYQKQGFKWADYLHRHGLGGCLADDMGLGKTLQAIALLASIYPEQNKPSLVVVPKSLLFNWESEILKFKPDLTYAVHHGSNRDMAVFEGKNLIITTYAMIRNDIELFQNVSFYYVILDESQNIKNLNSQISRAVMLLNSEHRLALSGTPIENNLTELYSLFRFLNPSMFGSPDEFNRNYAVPIQKNNDRDALYELKKKIYPFILRRMKRDVLKELPEKVEQTLYVDMSDEQKLFYEQRRRFYYETVKAEIAQNGIKKSQFFILQAISELRQIASIPESKSENGIISPKREVLVEQLLDLVANNHKVLVFANFLNALDCIAEDLEKQGIEYLLMTGATRDRKRLVERFQDDDACKVFLLTLKTGGIGLNLTAADYIFIFDPWWNRAAENQAIDRTHRIGQDKTVFAYKLITRGTIEEKILKLQEQKSELFEQLISSDGASIKSLDETDVEFVLGA
jgi:superfamily II DNA or RNA helicase